MAKPCPLTDLLRWPFLICSLKGKVVFAHPRVERAVGRKIRPGIGIDRLLLGSEAGEPLADLLRKLGEGATWSGRVVLRCAKAGKRRQTIGITLRRDPACRRQAWLIFGATSPGKNTMKSSRRKAGPSGDDSGELGRLRRALAKAEAIAANVTHEIRNPINVIQGLCETSLETPEADPSATLRKIRSSAQELAETVSDVLEFSRYDQGAIAVESIAFDPVRIIEESVAQFQPQAARKGVELAALIKADSPRSVLGDPIKWRRVAANLLGNAVKFTERGHVHASLEFRRHRGRLRATLKVRDTGIGIPADRLASIFEPYTQADSSTTRRFGGTGLGLTIVRSLTQAMRGDVRVISKEGAGSTFSATMVVSPDPGCQPLTDPDLSGQRFLLVGGHASVRQWTADSLATWGATCTQTTDQPEAEAAWTAAAASRQPYRRAIVDLPDDVSPRLPTLPAGQVVLVTSPGLEIRNHAQLLRPMSLTALRNHFSPPPHPSPGQAGPPEQNKPARRLRVLLAEDNEVNREVASTRLRRAGHEVSATVDGSAALELWRSKEFDAALLDIQMPLLDGLMVAMAIRAEEKARGLRRTTLVALTAMTEEADRDRCQAAGFDAYIAKPVRGAELLERLAALSANPTAGPAPDLEDEFAVRLAHAESEDAEDLRAAGRAFLRHAEQMIGRLAAARDAQEPEALSREAHGVRGMLSLMACAGLAKLAHRIERQPAEAIDQGWADALIAGLRKLREALRSRTDLSADG
jgi:two-component system sensor histidine kinase/response regulator